MLLEGGNKLPIPINTFFPQCDLFEKRHNWHCETKKKKTQENKISNLVISTSNGENATSYRP